MGSAVQYLSIETYKPVMIVKDPKQRKDRPEGYTYSACVDGSRKSIEALKLICKIKQPIDKIKVITCEQANLDTQKIKDTVMHIVEEMGCTAQTEFELLPSQYGRKTSEIIREYLLNCEDYVDFVVVGNQGADFSTNDSKKYLGSVANEVIRHTRINCVFMP